MNKATKEFFASLRRHANEEFFASLRRNANAVQKLQEPKHLKAEKEANRRLAQKLAWDASLEDLREPVSNIQL